MSETDFLDAIPIALMSGVIAGLLVMFVMLGLECVGSIRRAMITRCERSSSRRAR